MEGDGAVKNEKELTSTNTAASAMEELLSSTKEKSESITNDTLPTSSTDASTSVKLLHLVSDDPISSTSSEMDSTKSSSTNNVGEKTCSTFDTEAELLEMSIGVQASEKIEENVDDLVNDLETLLGESTDSFTPSVKSTEIIEKHIEENEKCDVDVHEVTKKPIDIAGDIREPNSIDADNASVAQEINPQGQNDQHTAEKVVSEQQEIKPIPEINIRRKTVEQDLEKVVCLSEESSDSDTNGAVCDPHKEFKEETDLIKIAESAPEVPEGDIQAIDDFLSLQQPEVVSSADSGSNLETILAVASLENESAADNNRVERRLSEKEIQEMEAIRMAVASITDSSQDTYDSFLLDNPVAQDVSENTQQEFPVTNQEVVTVSESLSKEFDDATLEISGSGDSQVSGPPGQDDLAKGIITEGELSGKLMLADDNAEPILDTETGDIENSGFGDEFNAKGAANGSELAQNSNFVEENESQGIAEVVGDNNGGDNLLPESAAEISKEVPEDTKSSSKDCFEEADRQIADNEGDNIEMNSQKLEPTALRSEEAPEDVDCEKVCSHPKAVSSPKHAHKEDAESNVLTGKQSEKDDSSLQISEVVDHSSDIKCSTEGQLGNNTISEESQITLEPKLNLSQTTMSSVEASGNQDTAKEETMESNVLSEDIAEKDVAATIETAEKDTSEQLVGEKKEVMCDGSIETEEVGVISDENNALLCKEVAEESDLRIPKKTIDMPATDLTEEQSVEEKQISNLDMDIKLSSDEDVSKQTATDTVEETKVENVLDADQKCFATEDTEVRDKDIPEEVGKEEFVAKEESKPGSSTASEEACTTIVDPTSPEQPIESGTTPLEEALKEDKQEFDCSKKSVVDNKDQHMEPTLETESVRMTNDSGFKSVHKETEIVNQQRNQEGMSEDAKILLKDENQFIEAAEGNDCVQGVDKDEERNQEGISKDANASLKEEDQFTEEGQKIDGDQSVDKEDDSVNQDIATSSSNFVQAAEKEIVLMETSDVKEDENASSLVAKIPKDNITSGEENDVPKSEEVVLNHPVEEHGGSASKKLIKEDEEMAMPQGTVEENNSVLLKNDDKLLETMRIGSDHSETLNNQDKPIESSSSISSVDFKECTEKLEIEGSETMVCIENNAVTNSDCKLADERETPSEFIEISEPKIMKPLKEDQEVNIKSDLSENKKNMADHTDRLDKGNEKLNDPKNTNLAADEIVGEKESTTSIVGVEKVEDSSENKSSDQRTVVGNSELPASEEEVMQHPMKEVQLFENSPAGAEMLKCSDVEPLVKENNIEVEQNKEIITKEGQEEESNLSEVKVIDDVPGSELADEKRIDAVGTEENIELPHASEGHIVENAQEENNSHVPVLEENNLPVSKGIDDVANEENIQLPASEEETQDTSSVLKGIDNVGAGEIIKPPVSENTELHSSEEPVAGERSLRSRTRRATKISEPLSINVEEMEKKDKVYSPKITIKPVKVPEEEVSTTSDMEGSKGSLKMTITKQSDKMRSILKVFNPEDDAESAQSQDEPIPKLIIKPKTQQVEQQHSPKMTTRSSKTYSPTNTRCNSPRVSIKPVTKPPEANPEMLSPLKITFKPVVKPEETTKKNPKALKEQDQKNVNPKITIKPIPKPPEVLDKEETAVTTPKVIIKPIKRHLEEDDAENEPERSSPKITIKPVIKLDEQVSDQLSTPKLKIKPIKKQDDSEAGSEKDEGSPKISIKPVVKPPEHLEEDDEEVKERIVLKINKGNLPTPTKDPKKREYPEDEKAEKVGIKLKFSTTGGHTHIVQEGEDSNKRQRKDSGYSSGAAKKDAEETPPPKRPSEERLPDKNKRLRSAQTPDKIIHDNNSDHIIIVKEKTIISENLRSHDLATPENPPSDISKIADLASQTTHIEATSVLTVGIATPASVSPPGPKRRGRPRKAHLEVREEFKDHPTSSQATPPPVRPQGASVADAAASTPVSESGPPKVTPAPSEGRPKRSCRGQNVIATLGIKPRKPRGGGRGRGGKVNMGDRETPIIEPPAEPVQAVHVEPEKEGDASKTNLKLMPTIDAKEDTQKQKEDTTKLKEENGNKKGSGDEVKLIETKLKKVLGEVEDLKRKKEDAEEHSPPKKKKEDKTPPRKLEVTTRRQRAQQQKSSEDAEQTEKVPGENPTLDQKESVVNQSERRPSTEATPSASALNTAALEIVIISTDEESCGKAESNEEQSSEKIFEQQKSELEAAEKSEVHHQIDIDEHKKETKLERSNIEEGKVFIQDDKAGEKKVEAASPEEDSDEDSEAERRREWILMKKQEAIKKCRAKRMEKLARAAELKKKRQEQAAQQREARKAAEEAERAAAEKVRATKRYGRYGVPKPQISLIDAPVQETGGTIKSHMGLFNSEIKRINITQPMLVDEDNEKAGHLKHLSSNSGLTDSSYEAAPPPKLRRSMGAEDVVMLDEETRMSADFRGSRAQTPAKHATIPPDAMVEDSQGSVGTEGGGKSRSSKAPKMEVFQDSESTVFTADQLAEYSWNGQGPYMLQEQVAQYLGIKSFKRKYPHITRRPVDMQERDYLKENSLATEAQCDLGLTAVIAQDILDIMYTDFQEKYEEYCRSQREKQARELANKQKFLNQITLKPGFDKLDILEQVIQSAAAWNQHLNKARREQRRAYMDLQNLTVQYPKSKVKVVPTPKIGHYPVALVPGQFTDYFKEYTPTELNNLPLNTMCYDEIKIPGTEMTESEESSESGSDSDSESGSASSDSNSSCEDEDCKDCSKKIKTESNAVRDTDSDDVVIIENDASSSDSVVLVSVTAAPVTA